MLCQGKESIEIVEASCHKWPSLTYEDLSLEGCLKNSIVVLPVVGAPLCCVGQPLHLFPQP